MKTLPTLLLGLAAILALVPAEAGDGCEPTTSNPEVDTLTDGGTGLGRYYVDNDYCQPGCIFSIWLYQESNGIDGLQRQDEVRDDTCGGEISGDSTFCYCGGTMTAADARAALAAR